jgi:hypothetical protein
MDLTVGDYDRTRSPQVLGNECSVAGNQSCDLGFIVDQQLRSDGCVRPVGSSFAVHGVVQLVEPRNNEPIRCGRADRRDRHPMQCSQHLKDLLPVGLAKWLLKREALSFDEREERYGIAIELDEGVVSLRRNRRDNETAPEGTQVDSGRPRSAKVQSKHRDFPQCEILS